MKKFLPIVIVAVVVGGACFFGGVKYGQSKTASNFPGGSDFSGQFSGTNSGQNASSSRSFGGANGSGMTSGEIISIADGTITIKLQDGGSKIVLYSDSTKVNKTTSSAVDELKAGDTVMVSGTTNSDGSVTAKIIQLGGTDSGMPQVKM